jgi:hypothetical protein
MTPFALLLLLTAARVDVLDGTVQIPPGQWQYEDLNLRQHPVLVGAEFEMLSSGEPVRLLLVRRQDVERLRGERPHGILAATAFEPRGRLLFVVHAPGDYAVVLDNRRGAARPAQAHLRVWLDFSARPGDPVTTLGPRRRMAVILLSFAFFFAVTGYSARRIMDSIKS